MEYVDPMTELRRARIGKFVDTIKKWNPYIDEIEHLVIALDDLSVALSRAHVTDLDEYAKLICNVKSAPEYEAQVAEIRSIMFDPETSFLICDKDGMCITGDGTQHLREMSDADENLIFDIDNWRYNVDTPEHPYYRRDQSL